MGLTRGNTEIVNVFIGKAITANGLTPLSEGFPIGEAWTRLILRLNLAIGGTGFSGAITEGELNILKSLTFKTSAGELCYNAIPGRPLYRLDHVKSHAAPPKDAIADSAGTFRVQYSLWFIDPLLARPEDFLLNTSRYNKFMFDLNMGGLADLYGTVGSATLAITADLLVERVRGILPKEIAPVEYNEVGLLSPVDPASSQKIDIEKSSDLAIKRLLIGSNNSATAGIPFSGTPADTIIDKIGFDTDRGELIQKMPWRILNSLNKQEYALESAIAGMTLIDFCKDGSKMSGVGSGGFSRFRIFWDNGTLSTSQISAVYDGFRGLK